MSQAAHKVVISRLLPEPVNVAAAEMFDAVFPEAADMTLAETLVHVHDHEAEGLLFATKIQLDRGAIAKLPPSLKIAATCSVGHDHIDIAAARRHGLIVTNTPDVLTDCTADFAVLLILNSCRRAAEYLRLVRDGRWTRPFGTHEMLGRSLAGKTLGIVGMGRIELAVASRARAFGMRIAYHDRSERLSADLGEARFFSTLEGMLPHCDVLTLHAPANEANRHMIDKRTLALLPRGAVIVNTARGSLVDEEALADALESGHIFAAGLDVFEREPVILPRLLRSERVIATPHMASATEETRTAMGMLALRNIDEALSRGRALTPMTGLNAAEQVWDERCDTDSAGVVPLVALEPDRFLRPDLPSCTPPPLPDWN